MMNFESQLKLQAYLDGELSAADAQAVAQWLATDAEASLLLKELKITKQALGRNESRPELPETREFFWSKIEREIERQEALQPTQRPVPMLPWWKKWLMPAVSLACLAITLVIGITQFSGSSRQDEFQTAMTDDSRAFTYRDETAGVTLVWLSDPSEMGIANPEAGDTIN